MKRLCKCEYSELEYKPVCVDGPLCVDVLIGIEEEAEAVCQAGNGAPYYPVLIRKEIVRMSPDRPIYKVSDGLWLMSM